MSRDLSWIATAVFFASVASCTAMTHKYDSDVRIEKLKLERAKIEKELCDSRNMKVTVSPELEDNHGK